MAESHQEVRVTTASIRTELEQRLLADPFDGEARRRYAELLEGVGELDAALQQYELSARAGATVAVLVGAARTLLSLGRREEAIARYGQARELPGFVPDEQLEALRAAELKNSVPRLSIVSPPRGPEAPANVVALPAPARDRVGFQDVAGMEDLKRTIRLQIIEPFLRPGLFEKFRKRAGGGVLLYGPPGCGKTMIARAVATECRAEFVSIGISDILNLYIGESERNLALVFEKARASRPCVLFFDELDALAYSRSKATSEHSRQVVNEFLAQLDGFGSTNQGVLILAATNMPWDVDPAMKRPGRFTRQVFVAPPDTDARARIVELSLEGVPHEAVDGHAIAAATPHFSGADIAGIVELAKEYALEDHITHGLERGITQQDLVRAAREARPSTLDWLRTARNLVKYAGADDAYRDVEDYLKKHKLT
jgi:ATP-dependent 26S proteasome regulatory subunit